MSRLSAQESPFVSPAECEMDRYDVIAGNHSNDLCLQIRKQTVQLVEGLLHSRQTGGLSRRKGFVSPVRHQDIRQRVGQPRMEGSIKTVHHGFCCGQSDLTPFSALV